MASSIVLSDNGVTSGSAGIKSQGGNDGVLLLQTSTAGGTATTAVTVDNAQNVGVGVTPSAWATVKPVVQFPNGNFIGSQGSVDTFYVGQNHYYDGTNFKYVINGYATQYQMGNGTGQHQWKIAASGTAGNAITFTQAMTLDASGNLLVGVTSPRYSGGSATIYAAGIGNTQPAMACDTNLTTGQQQIKFINPNGLVGTISTSGSLTSYNVSSDHRLKENILPLTGALDKISQLKPSVYNYKADPTTNIEGFIAHELQDVIPHAVTGKKDAVDAEGNPVYQGVDASFLIPFLTAAIKEQNQLITNLTERLVALEGK